MIPFRIKKLTDTAKAPTQKEGILWDLYVDDFCSENLKDIHYREEAMYNYDITHKDNAYFENHLDCFDRNHLPDGLPNECKLYPQGRILIKTGINLELPTEYKLSLPSKGQFNFNGTIVDWFFQGEKRLIGQGINNLRRGLISYAVAEIRPRSDNLESSGLFIENKIITGGEISFVVINHGHEAITIEKGEPIAKMLIKPVYPSKMEKVKEKIRKEKFLEEEEPTEIKFNLPKVKLLHF